MPRRIVINFRGSLPSTAAEGARYIALALAMKKRAEAHGANLCAWSALTFSFSFEPDELEEAVRLASVVREGAGAGLAAGMTAGDLASIGERGPLYGLAWGMPLVRAAQLSRAARPGEVVVDEVFLADCGDELESLGFRAEGDPIRRLVPVDAAAVDEAPLRPSVPDQPPPSSVSGPASRSAPDPHVETAKRALLQGDIPALERLIAELRETGERADLVERMSGFVALRRGATADALRRLRAAAEATKEPRQRARARLAYGVALAGAGRTESALLEALDALARAREADDAHGQHACALFLARLSSASGHADAASTWAIVAAQAEAADAG
jgi:hypothetical protein